MFKVGDAVVHPNHGAGVIEEIRERTTTKGKTKRYYNIKLRTQTQTYIMVPVKKAEKIGLRKAMTEEEVGQVWEVLKSPPESLPENAKTRHSLLREKLETLDILAVAEIIRDLEARQAAGERLRAKERNLHRKGWRLLTGELATVLGMKLKEVEAEIRSRLRAGEAPTAAS